MRILVLSDKVFTRTMGDGLRVHGLIRPLLQRHSFDLLAFGRPGEALDDDICSLFRDVVLVPLPVNPRHTLLRRFVNSVTVRDFKPTSGAMRDAIHERIRGENYDLLLDVAANALPNLPEALLPLPLVVDSIDEPLLREGRAIRSGPWRDRAQHLYRAWQFWLYERRMLHRAVLNLYVSEVDAAAYRHFFPSRPVAVLPNGVDIDYFTPHPFDPDANFIVFEGNMNFPPNVDAARRLVEDVLPRVKAKIPSARVCLVGRDPAPEVSQLASVDVEVTGTVDDVRPYLARASVFACPMQLGSGLKNKILQAWAMGRPVVATSRSLGGLSALDGINLLVRDDMEEFAHAVTSLLLDKARGASIGAAGRETAEREYSWDHRAEQFERLLARAVEESSDCGSPGSYSKSKSVALR